jgi:hypothetical protein
MNFISVTRLRIRKLRYVPAFLVYSLLSVIQARRTKDNLRTSITRESGLIFWTISVWRDESAMREFRNRGAHQRAMPKLRDWCDEATYVHWLQESTEPPDLATSFAHLVRDGIVSRVKHPSPDHEARAFSPPTK